MSNLILFTIRSCHRWCANFCPHDCCSGTACVAVPRHGGQHELCAAQELHFQFEGTPTNNLEVAFGRDSNTNGVLDVQEIDTVYGWRGGRYFIENVRAWERIETVAATNALCGVIDIHLENDAELVPRRFTATCGGEAAFTQFATPPPWLFRSDWTLMKGTLWSRFLNFMGIGEA